MSQFGGPRLSCSAFSAAFLGGLGGSKLFTAEIAEQLAEFAEKIKVGLMP